MKKQYKIHMPIIAQTIRGKKIMTKKLQDELAASICDQILLMSFGGDLMYYHFTKHFFMQKLFWK